MRFWCWATCTWTISHCYLLISRTTTPTAHDFMDHVYVSENIFQAIPRWTFEPVPASPRQSPPVPASPRQSLGHRACEGGGRPALLLSRTWPYIGIYGWRMVKHGKGQNGVQNPRLLMIAGGLYGCTIQHQVRIQSWSTTSTAQGGGEFSKIGNL